MIHSWVGIGVLAGCYNLPLHNPQATIRSADELITLASTVTDVVVDNGVNTASCITLTISELKSMKHFRVGDWCFGKVRELRLTGLTELKSVEIGERSFQNESTDSQLMVKNCPALVSLKIGNQSFKGFKRFNLSEVDGLKSVMIGDECFKECDLVLRELRSVESVCVRSGSFEKSRHTVVESLI